MCIGTPTAQELFIQRPQFLRQGSGVSLPPATPGSIASSMASRPATAPPKGTRPLSAKKPPRRPTSAPRMRSGDAAYGQRRGVAVEKRKKPCDPFKEFLSDDPVMEQLKLERTTEESYIRACKDALHHKAIMGKLDSEAAGTDKYLNLRTRTPLPNAKVALPPVKGLRDLQRDMMESLKNVCESNQEAMGSFIEKHEEKKRQKHQESQERDSHGSTSESLNEFKNMLHEVESSKSKTPKSKPKDLWKDGGATPFRNRYRKHHDQCMLENSDITQALLGYQAKRCKPTRKATAEL